MKRIFLVVIAFAFFGVLESAAQRIPPSQWGVRGGLTAPTLWSRDLDDTRRRVGVVVGGFARMDLTRRIALQPELLYVQKGASRARGGERTDVLKASYVQLPVLVTRAIPVQGPLLPYVMAGPAASLRVGESLEIVIDDESTTIPGEDVDLFRRADVGLVVGAGVGYPVHPDYRLLLDARYDLGLFDATTGAFGEDISARTSTLVLSLAVTFR